MSEEQRAAASSSWRKRRRKRGQLGTPGHRRPAWKAPASGRSRSPARGQRRGAATEFDRNPWGRKQDVGRHQENARRSRCSSELEIRLSSARAAASDSPAPARRLPPRPHAPGPGGHPAPSGRSPRTRLPVGSAGCNPRRHGDFTPPSWDPAARYRQPCTSCLKTQGRERARENPVLAEWREGRRPAGRAPEGAADGVASALLAMVGTRRRDPPHQRPPRAGFPRARASPCRPPGHQPSAHGALPFPAPAEVSPPHMYLSQSATGFLPAL